MKRQERMDMDRLLNSSKMKTIEISWKPDRTSKVPIYSQIVEYVTAKIQKGDWVEGERLPSQRRLSELFGVNRSTIVTAMEELLSYGIVESMGAAGTRISGGSWRIRRSGSSSENLRNPAPRQPGTSRAAAFISGCGSQGSFRWTKSFTRLSTAASSSTPEMFI